MVLGVNLKSENYNENKHILSPCSLSLKYHCFNQMKLLPNQEDIRLWEETQHSSILCLEIVCYVVQ